MIRPERVVPPRARKSQGIFLEGLAKQFSKGQKTGWILCRNQSSRGIALCTLSAGAPSMSQKILVAYGPVAERSGRGGYPPLGTVAL